MEVDIEVVGEENAEVRETTVHLHFRTSTHQHNHRNQIAIHSSTRLHLRVTLPKVREVFVGGTEDQIEVRDREVRSPPTITTTILAARRKDRPRTLRRARLTTLGL